MTPAAKREFERLNEQDDRDTRIIKRATARLEAELAAAQQRISQMQTDIELLTSELARARRACEAAGVEVL